MSSKEARELARELASKGRAGNDRVITVEAVEKIQDALDAAFARGVEAAAAHVDRIGMSKMISPTESAGWKDLRELANDIRALASTGNGESK